MKTQARRKENMAYIYTNSKGTKYYLHSKEAKLADGKSENIYYFRRNMGDNSVEQYPEGYKVKELKGYFVSQKQGVLAEIGLPILVKAN